MIRLLRLLSKEQGTALLACVAAAALLLLGGSGGTEGSRFQAADAGERAYGMQVPRFPEFLRDSFDIYWQGRDIFRSESHSTMPRIEIPFPEPRPPELSAPPFQPSPRFAELNRMESPLRYLRLGGTPPIGEGDLPPAAEIAALLATAEPEPPAARDHRGDRERETDVLYLSAGSPQEGEIVDETSEHYRLKSKDGKNVMTWEKSRVSRVERRWTYEERYREKRKSLPPGDAKACFDLAQWCLDGEVKKDGVPTGEKIGMRPEARQELKQAIALKRDYFEAIFQLGRLYREEALVEEAVALYRSALSAAGAEKPEVLHRLGECFEALGVTEAAVHFLTESFRENPRYTSGRIAVSRVLLAASMPEEALHELETAIDRFGVKDPEAASLRGRAHLLLGRPREARADLERSLQERPGASAALTALGVVNLLEGRVRDGSARFVEAVRTDPYAIEAWIDLALLHLGAGKLAEAERLFGAALQRDPSCLAAAAGLGLVKWRRGDVAGATADLQAALESGPSDPVLHYFRADLHFRAGEGGKALELLERCLRREFSFLPAHPVAGLAYLRESVLREREAEVQKDEAAKAELRTRAEQARVKAETLLRSAAEVDKSGPDPLLALGCLRAASGRPDEARDFLIEASKRSGEDPLLHYALGYLEYHYGEGDDRKRVESALQQHFLPGSQLAGKFADSASVEAVRRCAELSVSLADWLQTSVALDEGFERPDGADVGNRWVENDKSHGIAIALEQGRVRFSGKQVNKPMGITSLEREISRENLFAVEAVLHVGNLKDAECGVSLFSTKSGGGTRQGLHAGRDTQGALRTAMMDEARLDGRNMQEGWEKPKVDVPDPQELRLRFQRNEKKEGGVFDVLIWNPLKREWIPIRKDAALPGAGESTLKLVVWGRGYQGREYDFGVDDVRVYERMRR